MRALLPPESSARSCGHRSSDERSGKVEGASVFESSGQRHSDVPPNEGLNDFVTFEEVLSKWDENNRGRHQQRFLMIIADCCNSGMWVKMLNDAIDRAESAAAVAPQPGHEQVRPKPRDNICIQASCRRLEKSMVASNQLSSVFTKAFVAAQNRSTSENYILSAFDHMLLVSILLRH